MKKLYQKINNIWNVPFLPPIPSSVEGLGSYRQSLATRTRGEWEFLFANIEDIPSPYDSSQDYDFRNIVGWEDVIVPSMLTMQGYDIQNNVEYYYRRSVTIDTNEIGDNNVLVLFEGVYCNCRIWANNKYLTTHTGGFTPFVVDITDQIKASGRCELIVGVSDIEGTSHGIWNPNSIRVSDSSWASYYAHTNVCGILRDVTLFCLPSSYVLSQQINTRLSNNYKDGVISTDILVVAKDNSTLLLSIKDIDGEEVFTSTYDITDANLIDNRYYNQEFDIDFDAFRYSSLSGKSSDKKYSELYVPFKRCEVTDNLYGISIEEQISGVVAWTAESPNLYKIEVTLVQNNEHICGYTESIGFRQIDFGGANGTDKNKIYINGQEVKLRGVCRHDVSYLYGRSLTQSEELEEIVKFKENNINHVRTSHYPCSQNYLKLCDKYGIYVELENSVCFKGSNGYDMCCSAEEIMQSMSEMVEFYYNHPSILIWSSGNESGFEASSGFRLSYNYLKEKDPTRPAIFSYPFTVKSTPYPYDIFSKHYMQVTKNLGNKAMPKLHDEFAHIACYNLKDLMRDNNYRIAWGESIKKGWENIIKDDGALGCALWGGIDDIFYVPSNITITHQRHSAAQAVGYGEWGAVLDVFRREKPEAYLTKKAFSPVRLSDCKKVNGTIIFKLHNRFDHTPLNQVKCIIVNDKGTIIYSKLLECDIPPKSNGTISIADTANSESVTISFYHNGYEVEKEYIKLCTKPSKAKPTLISNSKIKVNSKTATLDIYDKGKLIADGPYYYVNSQPIKAVKRTITASSARGVDKYVIRERFGCLQSATYTITRDSNGQMHISVINSLGLTSLLGNNYGIAFKLHSSVDSVEWDKDTLYTCYPADHLEQRQGKAYLKAKQNNEYGVKPNLIWKEDSYDYFLNNEIESDRLYLTHDFKTTRTNINNYQINTDNGGLEVSKANNDINCMTIHTKVIDFSASNSELIIKKGHWRTIHRNREKECIVSRSKGSKLSYEFEGIGIKIYGTRSKEQGVINISIDGKLVRSLSTRSDICDVLDFMVLDSIYGLENGRHRIDIELADNKGVRISGFESMTTKGTRTQSIAYISRGKHYRSLAWGNYCGKRLNLAERQKMTFNLITKNK